MDAKGTNTTAAAINVANVNTNSAHVGKRDTDTSTVATSTTTAVQSTKAALGFRTIAENEGQSGKMYYMHLLMPMRRVRAAVACFDFDHQSRHG